MKIGKDRKMNNRIKYYDYEQYRDNSGEQNLEEYVSSMLEDVCVEIDAEFGKEGSIPENHGYSRKSIMREMIPHALALTECKNVYLIVSKSNRNKRNRYALIQRFETEIECASSNIVTSQCAPVFVLIGPDELCFDEICRRVGGSDIYITNLDFLFRYKNRYYSYEEKRGNAPFSKAQRLAYLTDLPAALGETVTCRLARCSSDRGGEHLEASVYKFTKDTETLENEHSLDVVFEANGSYHLEYK